MELSLDVKFKRFVECDYFLRLNSFRSCNLASHHLKMSELENKVGSAENGFLNCQQCSRRYLTFVGLDYHVKLEHSGLNLKQIKEKQDSNLKQIEEKQDLNCVLNDVSAKIHPEFQEDQESFLKLNIQLNALQEKLKSYQLITKKVISYPWCGAVRAVLEKCVSAKQPKMGRF